MSRHFNRHADFIVEWMRLPRRINPLDANEAPGYFVRCHSRPPHTEDFMKLIIAYIQPDKLNSVKEELFKADVSKLSVVANAVGCGKQKGYTEAYRGIVTEINLRPKTRIEIAVNDEFVKVTTDAIVKGARSGKIGDGKIFIIPLEECIRIRTGETGQEAIG